MKTITIKEFFPILIMAFTICNISCFDKEFDSPPINAPKYLGDSTISIKNFKAKYEEKLDNIFEKYFEITDDDIIMGIVVANDISGNLYKQIFIDDGEEGLCIAIDRNNIYGDFRVGQKVFIETKGFYIGKYKRSTNDNPPVGMLQLGYRYLRTANDGSQYYTIGQASWELFKDKTFKHDFPDASKVVPIVVSFNEIIKENHGRLVTFEGVEFIDADGKEIFAYTRDNQVQTLDRIIRSKNNNNATITTRMSSAANFASQIIPQGIGNVTGILTTYGAVNQLLVRDSLDIDFNTNPDGWGTKNSPWTVNYAINNQDEDKEGWVKGVIVGTLQPGINESNPVTKNEDIAFEPPYIIAGYVVIAESADVRDWTKCVVVNLPGGSAMFSELNLLNNPDNIGKTVRVTGKLEKIMNAAGVKIANGTISEFVIDKEQQEPGDGSKEKPFSIEEAKVNLGKNGVWIKGYIVGAVDGLNIFENSKFSPPFTVNTNLLVADSPQQTDISQCIPVQLPSGSVRNALNLVSNLDNLGKEVKLFGNLRLYFAVPGLGDTSDYELDSNGGGDDTFIFHAPFSTSLDPFTQYSVSGTQIWEFSDQYKCALITGFVNSINYQNEDWLISPTINLTENNEAHITFEHVSNYGNNKNDFTLWISANYTSGAPSNATWKQIEILNYSSGTGWNFVNSGKLNIPAEFTGKNNIRFAFKYLSSTTQAGTWEINNVYVKEGAGEGGTDPDPEYIFLETFGTGIYNPTRPKIGDFTDFDNKDVTYSDPTGNADIRTAGDMNAHVWFPANREAKLIIEGINISGYSNVKLSYDFSSGSTTPITANKLIVKINDVEQIVPATTIQQNVFSTINIAESISASEITIEFHATEENNPTGVGFRLDNIKLIGDKN